ncbi:hypothetical protein ACONUD_17005 [Microbulbifer harenosus]|uniref:DUF2846 domain-containing protein n=1 Tax=Microbulbifer harenosus TaxID=2576840 RepID=A0ABY2UHX0_9GAMM|nr:hypothetical protein [Microbulbifer harenosus]TLM73398.1 hypothetical protein FDY93_19020 [Microbulbifer harenosus]
MNRFIVLLFLLLGIVSCASQKSEKAMDAFSESKVSKAHLFGHSKKNFFSTEYNAFLKGIYDENNNAVFESNFWKSPIKEIDLHPGTYLIKVSCQNGYFSGYPEVQITLKASESYEVYCSVQKGKNAFGMSVDAAVEAEVKKL